MARNVKGEVATIIPYRVNRCGYTLRGDASIAFGSLTEVTEDLAQWARGKRLGETRIVGNSRERSTLGVFLLDARRNAAGRTLLTVWNEVPATDGSVASVRSSSGVGTPAVVMNRIAPGTIPGYVTYFYVLPEHDIVACVRFQHSTLGQSNMRSYVRSFLRYCGRHVVLDEERIGADIRVLGYVKDSGDDPLKMSPVFLMERCVRRTDLQMLLVNTEKIVKVVRRTDLDLQIEADRTLWQKMAEHVSMDRKTAGPAPIRVEYSMATSLTRAELGAILKSYSHNLAHDDWEDIGFVLKGEPTRTYWLSRTLVRQEIELAVRRDSPEVVNAASLMQALNQAEDSILTAVQGPSTP